MESLPLDVLISKGGEQRIIIFNLEEGNCVGYDEIKLVRSIRS